MSSKLGDYAGRFAVDGIYKPENDFASLAHTEADSNPWIQIDLSQSYCISAVKVWNRNGSANGMSITFTVLYILLAMKFKQTNLDSSLNKYNFSMLFSFCTGLFCVLQL